jgi:ankyrin repeat protein
MAILAAIRDGDLKRLRELIAAGADLRETDEHGCFTSLGEAAYLGRVDMVRLLIEAGTEADDSAHECALGAAALGGQMDTARALIEAGASIEGKSASGLTPLMNAARVGQLEMVRYLLDVGADVQRRFQELRWEPSRSALDFAVEGGHEEVAAYLLEHGACFQA